MGWQNRDWAKLRDNELEALYGFRQPRRRRPRPSIRTIVWSCVAVLALAVGGFAYTQMPHGRIAGPEPSVLPPDVVYGKLGTFLGQPGACTELELLATGSWRCDTFELQAGALLSTRFAEAAPYDGACTLLKVDQTNGRWVCVSVAPPAPDDGVDS